MSQPKSNPPTDDGDADGHTPASDTEEAVLLRLALVKAAMAFIGRAPAVLALYQDIPAVLQRDFEGAHLRAVTAAADFLETTFRRMKGQP